MTTVDLLVPTGDARPLGELRSSRTSRRGAVCANVAHLGSGRAVLRRRHYNTSIDALTAERSH
jgi:hypothetical protein